MPNNVTITFEGLLLFCFPRKTAQQGLDIRTRCEIGILNETGKDEHEVVIEIRKESPRQRSATLLTAAQAGMSRNPLKISQQEIRKFSGFHFYLDGGGRKPPLSGRVVRDRSFDLVLDIEGPDFYNTKVTLIDGRYTPLIMTSGIFRGENFTGTAAYSRLNGTVVNEIKEKYLNLKSQRGLSNQQFLDGIRPGNWSRLRPVDKLAIGSFARQIAADLDIAQGQSLVLKGTRDDQTEVTVFSLLPPSEIGASLYRIKLSNLDKDLEMARDVVCNCAGATHHSHAIKSPVPRRRPRYGLSINFDDITAEEFVNRSGRSDPACCEPEQGGLMESLSGLDVTAKAVGKKKPVKGQKGTKKGTKKAKKSSKASKARKSAS